MARNSKLNENQWAELIRRHLIDKETITALAKEYKVAKSTVSERISERVRLQKDVANQLAGAELKFLSLPMSEQIVVRSLTDDIKAMNADLSSAGRYAAGTAKMFARAAHDASSKIMFQAMSEDGETIDPDKLAVHDSKLMAIMKSTQIANEAGKLPLKMAEIYAKNKDNEPPETNGSPVKFYIPENGRN